MLRKLASLILPAAVLASTAACTAETSADVPADPRSETVDPQGYGPCTSGGVVVPCQEVICSLPGSPEVGRGPAFGYYSRATCDSYAGSCGKTTAGYNVQYRPGGIVRTICVFE
jgi:hypothetical protein